MSLDDSNLSPEPTVGQAAAQLFRHPAAQLVANWNWKSALFSVLNRGSIFLITTLKRGAFERSVAVGVEMVFAAIAAGIYSAFIQSLRLAKPRWLANLIVGAGLPSVLLLLDYLAHRYTGMRHMQSSIIFLGFWSSLASLFNLFIMRRGVWLVGKQSGPLWRDLVRMPVLIGTLAHCRRSRHPRRPATPRGGNVRGCASCRAWASPFLVVAGAIVVFVLPRAERRISGPFITENHCRHQCRRIARTEYPGLLGWVHDRDPGGHFRGGGSLRRLAVSDRIGRVRLLFRGGDVSQLPQEGVVHHLVDNRADRCQRIASARDHRSRSSRGQRRGGGSRPHSLRVVLLHLGNHDPDRNRDAVCTENRSACAGCFGRVVEIPDMALRHRDPGCRPACVGRPSLRRQAGCPLSTPSASAAANPCGLGAVAPCARCRCGLASRGRRCRPRVRRSVPEAGLRPRYSICRALPTAGRRQFVDQDRKSRR